MVVDMRDTGGMSQYEHARALHILEDTGLDPDDARYVMKRLYDLGFTVRSRDPQPGTSPPAAHPRKVARAQARADLLAHARDEIEAARAAKRAEEAAAIEAARKAEAEERAARERRLAVQAVLAGMH